MSSNIIVRLKKPEDVEPLAVLIRDSLNVWYKRNRGFDSVVPSLEAASIYTRVYDELDPDCCVVAEDVETGNLAGSCFYHPRPTHVSLGLMTVSPDYFGQKVSTKILNYIINVARGRNQSLRLVSSAMNLDSFSLYNRAGFIPTLMFQDMQIPAQSDPVETYAPAGTRIREATLEDADEIARREKEIYGIERGKDFRYFIENRAGIWGGSVLVDETSGEILGAMFSVNDPGCAMIGPGFARTEEQAAALARAEFNRYPDWSPIILVPTDAPDFRRSMYLLGARNTETHVAQVLGEPTVKRGVVVPTFMPETA